MKLITPNEKGFTLVELLLAMVLFSLTMVIATVGFIGMNRSYTRAVVRKQLSENVQSVTDSLTKAIQSDGRALNKYKECPSGDGAASINCPSNPSSTWKGILCFAGSRYIWSERGLYKQTGPASACSTTVAANYQESTAQIVNPRFKVDLLTVDPVPGNSMFVIKGVVRTSEDSAFENLGNPAEIRCKGSASGLAQTCSIERFNFIVNGRGGEV